MLFLGNLYGCVSYSGVATDMTIESASVCKTEFNSCDSIPPNEICINHTVRYIPSKKIVNVFNPDKGALEINQFTEEQIFLKPQKFGLMEFYPLYKDKESEICTLFVSAEPMIDFIKGQIQRELELKCLDISYNYFTHKILLKGRVGSEKKKLAVATILESEFFPKDSIVNNLKVWPFGCF
tara:strand:+ start:873 stop:1415 length:543 start_codon:yes stop_codon:yes gene_type:complete